MPHMPYVHHIGLPFDALSAYGRDNPLELALLRDAIINTSPKLSATQMLLSAIPSLQKQLPGFDKHLDDDWFNTKSQPGNWGSGWWKHWRGDADGITCETVRRSIEVALGIDHAAPSGTVGTRHWTIQYIWVCGAPMFQGWVSWWSETNDPSEGYVTTVITTPGNGHPLYSNIYGNTTKSTLPLSVGTKGSWVIGQETVLRAAGKKALSPQPFGTGFLTHGGRLISQGKVTAYAPTVADGGVA